MLDNRTEAYIGTSTTVNAKNDIIVEANSAEDLLLMGEHPGELGDARYGPVKLSPLGPYHSRLISSNFVFDTSRIKTNLGWQPTRTNDEMLREAYRFYAERSADRSEELSAHRQGAKMGILRVVKWLS